MSLKLQDAELLKLMRDFYTLTGIRLVLFDAEYRELFSYPSGYDTFCAVMRRNGDFDKKCRMSDKDAFEKCKQCRALHVHKCHAGLTEATVPLFEGERIIGFMMLGQITASRDKERLTEELLALAKEYGAGESLLPHVRRIKYKNEEQIRAASGIMEACTAYVRLKELVTPSGKRLIDAIDRFIEEHIGEPLDVARICEAFSISRTRLYDTLRPYTDGGIAGYLKRKRLEHAKNLIRTSSLSIPEIASASGFSDYNYFLRLFKKAYGVSSKAMRKRV